MISMIKKNLFLCLAGLLLSGCSTVVNSHRQKADMMHAYEYGDNTAVIQKIDQKLSEPRWYNSSVVNTGDEIMWRLESGSMNFHLGNFKKCIDQLSIAERLIQKYDDRAKVSVRDAGAEVGTALTNLNTLPYRGFCRDRIALSIYKSLAYLGNDNESAFRAQLRRLRSEQKKVQDDYRAFFEKEKAEIDAEKKKNPEAARQTAAIENDNAKGGNVQNTEFNAGLKEVTKIANRGYGNFLNPAAIFLSGLGSVRDENYDNARIDFKRLHEAMPNSPLFKQYYVTILKKAQRPVPAGLKNVKPFDFPLDRDCIYVIFANGKSAAFRQIAVYFPIMTAWPMCEFYVPPFANAQIQADGQQYTTAMLADMDGIIAQEFHERLPGIITRIVLSTLIKEGAYYTSLALVSATKMDPTAKALTLIAIALGGAAYRTAMNTADTRSWEILPKEFQLTQFPMPKDRRIGIDLTGRGKAEMTVQIPEDCRSAIIYIGAPSVQNIVCRVLPIKSK